MTNRFQVKSHTFAVDHPIFAGMFGYRIYDSIEKEYKLAWFTTQEKAEEVAEKLEKKTSGKMSLSQLKKLCEEKRREKV